MDCAHTALCWCEVVFTANQHSPASLMEAVATLQEREMRALHVGAMLGQLSPRPWVKEGGGNPGDPSNHEIFYQNRTSKCVFVRPLNVISESH